MRLQLVCVFAAACGSGRSPAPSPQPGSGGSGSGSAVAVSEPPPPPRVAPSAKQLAALADAMTAHDAKRYAALFDEHGVRRHRPHPDSVGRDAIAADVQAMFDAVPDARLAFARAWLTGGSTIVATWVWTGTDKATHRAVGLEGVAIADFTDDGLVRELRDYFDDATLRAQVDPAAPAGSFRAPAALRESLAVVSPAADDASARAAVAPLYVALDAKQRDAVLAFFSEASTLDDNTAPRAARGLAAAQDLFTSEVATFPDFTQLPLDHQWAVGGTVISEGTLRGTYKPAGKRVELHFVDLIDLAGGKVARIRTFSNAAELAAQLR